MSDCCSGIQSEGVFLNVNRFVREHLVQRESIIDSSTNEFWRGSLRNIQAQEQSLRIFLRGWWLDKQTFWQEPQHWLSLYPSTEFVIEYEESQWEPGNWKELLRVPGNHNSAVLKLHGHVDYCFRVSGVNTVGRGPPSEPTERYKPPPAGLRLPLSIVYYTFW